jgi:hypothetical protein
MVLDDEMFTMRPQPIGDRLTDARTAPLTTAFFTYGPPRART